jgi:solute carrier family 25 iron transporter 28/37
MVASNESLRKIFNPSQDYDVVSYMISGSISGAIAAFLTNPFDVIKTKLQTQNLSPCPKLATAYSHLSPDLNPRLNPTIVTCSSTPVTTNFSTHIYSIREAFELIIRENGYFGLFRGATPRILVHAPSVAITWTVYEMMKNFLSQL